MSETRQILQLKSVVFGGYEGDFTVNGKISIDGNLIEKLVELVKLKSYLNAMSSKFSANSTGRTKIYNCGNSFSNHSEKEEAVRIYALGLIYPNRFDNYNLNQSPGVNRIITDGM